MSYQPAVPNIEHRTPQEICDCRYACSDIRGAVHLTLVVVWKGFRKHSMASQEKNGDNIEHVMNFTLLSSSAKQQVN
jgi:hypothetical protein